MAKNKSPIVEVNHDREKLQHYDRILELGAHALELQERYEERKVAAKEAKEEWEVASLELQQAIRRANDPQKELDFNRDEDY